VLINNGDVSRPKSKGLSRFYYINPNGVSHHRDLLDFCEILQSLRDTGTDVFGLAETNLDTRKPEIRKRCEEVVTDFYGTGIFVSSTSKIPSSIPYKPDGTCMGISNKLCG
jgi:hypothetical protein